MKDQAIHRPIGLIAWERRQGRWMETDPFGPEFEISTCQDCGYFLEGRSQHPNCPACASSQFIRCTVAQPLGFRTDYREKDYDGTYETVGRAGTHRLGAFADHAVATNGGLVARSAKGPLARFNTSSGKLFRFAKYSGWPGWIDAGLIGNDRYGDLDLPSRTSAPTGTRERALGDLKVTDVLLIGADGAAAPFVDARPVGAARRGAWLSLGYLARRALAVWQDISPDELDVGLRIRLANGDLTGESFLADTLANGAGYCSFAGRQDNFERLCKEMLALGELWADEDVHSCDSSCYDCLRDYRNQQAHSLLDWRLGLDLLTTLVQRRRPANPHVAPAHDLAERFCVTFDGWRFAQIAGFPICLNDQVRTAIAIHHPLDEMRPEWASEAVLDLYDELADFGFPLAPLNDPVGVHPIASFDLQRRPGWVEAQARSTGFA